MRCALLEDTKRSTVLYASTMDLSLVHGCPNHFLVCLSQTLTPPAASRSSCFVKPFRLSPKPLGISQMCHFVEAGEKTDRSFLAS